MALSKRPATVQILLRLASFDTATLEAAPRGAVAGDCRDPQGVWGLGDRSRVRFRAWLQPARRGRCQVLGARRLSWLHEETELPALVASLSRTIQGMLIPPRLVVRGRTLAADGPGRIWPWFGLATILWEPWRSRGGSAPARSREREPLTIGRGDGKTDLNVRLEGGPRRTRATCRCRVKPR